MRLLAGGTRTVTSVRPSARKWRPFRGDDRDIKTAPATLQEKEQMARRPFKLRPLFEQVEGIGLPREKPEMIGRGTGQPGRPPA